MKNIDELLKKTSESIQVNYVEPSALLSKIESKEEEKEVKKPFWTKPKLALVSTFALASIATAIIIPTTMLAGGHTNEMGFPAEVGSSGHNNTPAGASVGSSGHNNTSARASVGELVESTNKRNPAEVEVNADVLRTKANAGDFSSTENTQGFKEFVNKINNYSNALLKNVNDEMNAGNKNSAYSPASIFYALSMLSKITVNQDKTKVLSILGVTEDEINAYLPSLYRACNRTYTEKGTNLGKESINNSIWLDDRFNYDDDTLNDLANIFFTDCFNGDFQNENEKMNEAVSNYVYKTTEGLLEPQYKFSENTAFVLLNTLFFQDVWNIEGLPLSKAGNGTFKQYDGQNKSVEYYKTVHSEAKIHETEKYKSMYAETYNGFKIDFMLPKDGVDVEELFSSAVIEEHESHNYIRREIDTESDLDPAIYGDSYVKYYTNIEFAEFEAGFDDDIIEPLYDTFDITGITQFGNFVTPKEGPNNGFYISQIIHTTKVEVKKDTIKGAAATAIEADEATAMPGREVRSTLRIDRPFVYTIKDPLGIKLFQGIVYNV